MKAFMSMAPIDDNTYYCNTWGTYGNTYCTIYVIPLPPWHGYTNQARFAATAAAFKIPRWSYTVI